MIETSIEKIDKKAHELSKNGKDWHIHMLSSSCILNNISRNAFILEDTSDKKTYVHYSEDRKLIEGKRIASMIYDLDGKGNKKLSEAKKFSKNASIMIRKAESYNKKGIPWHHHLFFPDCMFNKHKGKWCLIFEDPIDGKTTELVSKTEPKEEQEKLEKLFYAQKK